MSVATGTLEDENYHAAVTPSEAEGSKALRPQSSCAWPAPSEPLSHRAMVGITHILATPFHPQRDGKLDAEHLGARGDLRSGDSGMSTGPNRAIGGNAPSPDAPRIRPLLKPPLS